MVDARAWFLTSTVVGTVLATFAKFMFKLIGRSHRPEELECDLQGHTAITYCDVGSPWIGVMPAKLRPVVLTPGGVLLAARDR